MRVATDDSAGFTAALTKISSTDYTYALAPITTDLDAQLVVATHAGTMSQPDVKNFRRAYLGYDSPGQYQVLSGAAFTPLPLERTPTVTSLSPPEALSPLA